MMGLTTRSLSEIQTPSLLGELSLMVDDCGIAGMKQKLSDLETENAALKRRIKQLEDEKSIQDDYSRKLYMAEQQLKDYKCVCEANKTLTEKMKTVQDTHKALELQVQEVIKELAELRSVVKANKEWTNKQSTSQRNRQKYTQYHGWGPQ